MLGTVEPLASLTDVLERMVSGRTKTHELERLLPWAWPGPTHEISQLKTALKRGASSYPSRRCRG